MPDSDEDRIPIEVAYARPDTQLVLTVVVPADTTVQGGIEQSGILERFPEIDLGINKVGIFGKLTTLTASLNPKDRIEIYRPLIADPKEVRRQRAAAGKRTVKNGSDLTRSG